MKKQIREIRIIDLFLYLLLPFFIICALITASLIVKKLLLPDLHGLIIAAVLIPLLYYPTKYFAIGAVLAYKAFAPLSVRDRCRFEPTCSTYMIMAIKKYGLFIGVYKGIRRILRCRPPYGGVDLP